MVTVHVHVRGGVGGLELQVQLLALGQLAAGKGLGIVAGAAMIVVAAVLAVHAVPGVGQVNSLPAVGGEGQMLRGDQRGVLGEAPGGVDVFLHEHTSFI